MPDFKDVLFVADYDHTLTGPDGQIPPRNLEAIAWFIAHGGSFTVCSGRSIPLFAPVVEKIPMNAPAVLFNGGCCYDFSRREMLFQTPIGLDAQTLCQQVLQAFPGTLLEIQEVRTHYMLQRNENLAEFCRRSQCPIEELAIENVPQQIMKLAIYQEFRGPDVAQLFEITPQEDQYFAGIVHWLQQKYGQELSAVRSAPRVVDVQSARATKGNGAKKLAQLLDKPVLAAAGDSDNDLTMLHAAQYAFVPADASIDPTPFHKVCPCGAGSVADALEALAAEF